MISSTLTRTHKKLAGAFKQTFYENEDIFGALKWTGTSAKCFLIQLKLVETRTIKCYFEILFVHCSMFFVHYFILNYLNKATFTFE